MSRREAILSAAVIFVVALAVRAVAASTIVFPKPEDTAYYVEVARNLVAGHGLVSDAIWSYQTPPLTFPRPAFEVWLPLPSLLAAIPMAVLGNTFAAAQPSSVVVGAAVPVLAWRLAADVAQERGMSAQRARTLALGTGLTATVYLPLVLHSALPDSTMPFAALSLAACILMARIVRDPRGAHAGDPRLLALGLAIGLAAWTRNDAVWLAVAWVVVAWLPSTGVAYSRRARLRMIAVVGVVAALVFAPWAYRDWLEFGTPLPGQALANALSVTGFDIFAWNDPPTLSRYLAVGPARLVAMRLEGLAHNTFDVLVFLGVPVAAIGLVALPWFGRARSLRPLLITSLLTFLFTSLVFPVATTWGTFLHAAAAIQVLLLVSCLLALDAAIARIGVVRGWTRPVAWLGSALTIFAAVLFTAVLLPSFGTGSQVTRAQYAAIAQRMDEIGHPLDRSGPVITNFPIWLAEATGADALALPDEPPSDVLDLAHAFPGTRTVIVVGRQHARYPKAFESADPKADCFKPLALVPGGADPGPLDDVHAYEVVCP